jgi:hypothetical protein
VASLIIGETGTISKLLRQYLNYIPGNSKYRKQPYQAQSKYLEKY